MKTRRMRMFIIRLMIIMGSLFSLTNGFSQGTSINTSGASPDPSAMLDVSSTLKGMLVPRMTQAQKLAISSAATGLLIYQTDNTKGFWYYDGTTWVQAIGPTGFLGAGTSVGNTTYWDGSTWVLNSSNIYNAGGNIGIGTTSPSAKFELSGGLKVIAGLNTDKNISLTGGSNSSNGLGGDVTITGGSGYNMHGGNVNIAAGYTSSWSAAGLSSDVFIKGGIMESTASNASIQVGGGKAEVGGTQETAGGDLTLLGGNANLGNRNGGNIIINPGTASGAGTAGRVGIGTVSPGQRLDVQGGSINASGSLMTGSTARIDASGNLINIGNITATGASTYTSGAGTALALQGGNSGSGTGGQVKLTGGTGAPPNGGTGAFITVNGGGPNYGAGGILVLSSGLQGPGNWWDPGHNGAVVFAINGTEYMRVDGNQNGYQGCVGIGTSSPIALLHLKDGHLKSEQSTTLSISGTSFGITPALTAGSTDVKGNITTTGTNSGGTSVITVTFGKAYNSSPVVVASCANSSTVLFYVTSSTTSFSISFANGVTAPAFNYIVME